MKKLVLVTLLLVVLSASAAVFFAQSAMAEDVAAQKKARETIIDDNQASLEQFTHNFAKNWLQEGLLQTGGRSDGDNSRADGGAIGGVGRMIGMTFNKPADTQTYVADILHNMNIAQPAYAQGLGFSALQPVLQLWKVFRDIAYVFFVFIFLVIGFAIMFRKSLGGQAAVTVQQALPRIIVALLAVSFSYAIAGLMIDLMWIVMYFLITIFSTAGLLPTNLSQNYAILNQNVFGLFSTVISQNFAQSAANVIGDFVSHAIGDQFGTTVISSIVGGVTSVLATLIIFVAILFAMFRTFFALIKVYLEIILTIIFAPVILMMGAINGNAFGNWLKGLVANLAVFPVLLVFIIVGFMLINQGTGNLQSQLQQGGFIPPFVPGRDQVGTIGMIGGIAAIMLLPEVVSIVGKYKPASIFEEFGGKAFGNVSAGQVGIPLFTSAAAGGAGAALGGGYGLVTGARKGLRGRELLSRVASTANRGYQVQDEKGNVVRTIGGFRNAKGEVRGYNTGQNIRKVVDDIQDQRFLEPDNSRALFEKLIQQREPKKEEAIKSPPAPPAKV